MRGREGGEEREGGKDDEEEGHERKEKSHNMRKYHDAYRVSREHLRANAVVVGGLLAWRFCVVKMERTVITTRTVQWAR